MTTSTSKFRELVTLLLKVDGLPVSQKPSPPRRLSAAVFQDTPRGDLQGIPGWTINARYETHRDLAGGIEEARQDADADGNQKFAVIWARHGARADESYVVMNLQTFAAVLRAELEIP
jgi:hypothetical protein